tara:strand:+ start:385 stop:534 length:150 start_codon:yes stop_codon:yes gene_type:complete
MYLIASKITLMTKKAKQSGIANSVKKDGTSKIVELVRPTFKESYAINHP